MTEDIWVRSCNKITNRYEPFAFKKWTWHLQRVSAPGLAHCNRSCKVDAASAVTGQPVADGENRICMNCSVAALNQQTTVTGDGK